MANTQSRCYAEAVREWRMLNGGGIFGEFGCTNKPLRFDPAPTDVSGKIFTDSLGQNQDPAGHVETTIFRIVYLGQMWIGFHRDNDRRIPGTRATSLPNVKFLL